MTSEIKFKEIMTQYIFDNGHDRLVEIGDIKNHVKDTHKFDVEDMRLVEKTISWEQKVRNIVSHHSLRQPGIVEIKYEEPIINNIGILTGKSEKTRFYYLREDSHILSQVTALPGVSINITDNNFGDLFG